GRLIFDRKKGEERPITSKDIVILLRGAKGYADIYYEALMREGIPAFVDTSDGYFDTLEIEIFLNLLRIIDNRKQDIPLLSILRSPIFGFTIEELIGIRIHSKETDYYHAFAEYAISGVYTYLQEKCRGTMEQIHQWKKQAPLMTLEDFLWMLIRETGYYEYIGGIPGGSQRQANLRALIDKAVQFQNSQMKGLFSFINYIEAIKNRKVPMGQVKLLGENDDVVRIMTIHKSKGLEFPVVLVGGLGKRFNRDSDTYQVSLHKDIGIGLRFVDKENSCYKKTLIQTVIEQKKRRESLAEELRILYVAFTRAMDRLILLGTVKDIDTTMEAYSIKGKDFTGAKSYLDFLIPAIEQSKIILKQTNRKDISFRKEEIDEQKNAVRKLILGKVLTDQGQEDLREEIERRLGFEYGHKPALELKSKFTVTELSRISEGKQAGKTITALDAPKFTSDRNKFSGAEKGTILHKVMEQLDFRHMGNQWNENTDNDTRISYIKKVVNDLVQREILTLEEAETVSWQKIIGFFDTEIGKRASNAEKLFKEVSFNIIKELSGEKIIIQGTIDCYFVEKGKYILLDYKSNFVNDTMDDIKLLTDNYKAQLELYKEALERIRKIKVEEAYLYLFSINREIKLF
ncbi:MAG: 3'-5' exonuclease, partial [Bacillota bacterium]